MAPSNRKPAPLPKKPKSKINKLTLESFPAGPKHGSSLKTSPPMPPPAPSGSSSTIQASGASKPLTSVSLVDINGHFPVPLKHAICQLAKPNVKEGKSSSLERESTSFNGDYDQLWVDEYKPETEVELAVHKHKVADVRRWLTEAFEGGPTGVLSTYRRILALTGPAGTGKTAVIQVLARELDFEILEWSNAMDDNIYTEGNEYLRESLTMKFQTFLSRASSCGVLPPEPSSPSASTSSKTSRRIILFEDFPNVLHPGTAAAFHDALDDFVISESGLPLVLVISDAGTRGEDLEDDILGSRRTGKQAIDVRSIVPPTIFRSPYFTEIQFNPVAPTLLTKALNKFIWRHFSCLPSKFKPGKDVVQMIVESAHGDIRSAIMTLQFVCVLRMPKGKKTSGARLVLEAVTRREQSLELFHMLGKVLYNKRKGDSSNPSATAKAREREDELDTKITNQPDLPPHLTEHTRRGSRVDVDKLYADSPIDTSLFALYLHQNYTQFCNEVDECDAVCESLSWIDAMGGEMWWAQQNPHRFHILTLGTLHGLPSPVPRRSQRMFKPAYFDVLKKNRAAGDSVTETEAWLNGGIQTEGGRRWGRDEILLEMGGMLKAMDACGIGNPPSTHTRFTTMSFVHPARMSLRNHGMQQLGEAEAPGRPIDDGPGSGNGRDWKRLDEEDTGGWLEGDDIQDF